MTDIPFESGIARSQIIIPYSPRKAFLNFHDTEKRFSIVVAHRRAGKTVAAINKMIKKAMEAQRPDSRYGYVAPYLAQAKEIAWNYVKRYTEGAWRAPPNEAELRVELVSGATIRLHGSDNPERLRGAYFDGCVMDEFASQRAGIWGSIVRPMLADRQGWAIFIGTPKGHNAFYDRWKETRDNPDWFRLMVRADESKILLPDELEAMQEEMTEDEYNQEMLCSFEAAIKGAYYAKQLNQMDASGRICTILIDRGVNVHTAWDLGRTDATAIWFIQCVGRERRLVDYYENSQADLAHYVEVLHDKRRERKWTYGQHYFPHDVKVHMLDSPLSRLETLRSLGILAEYPMEASNKMDSINAVRRMLDRTYVDPVYCERGLDCLRNYRADWDDKNRVFIPTPRHDEYSNGADALATFATQYDDPRAGTSQDPRRRRFQGGAGPSSWSA